MVNCPTCKGNSRDNPDCPDCCLGVVDERTRELLLKVAQLEADLARTERERDQAIELGRISKKKISRNESLLRRGIRYLFPRPLRPPSREGGVMELQVDDVVRFRFYRGGKRITGFMGNDDEYVVWIGRSRQFAFCRDYFWSLAKTIHRPTPDGMVQVWPEVQP